VEVGKIETFVVVAWQYMRLCKPRLTKYKLFSKLLHD